MIGCLRTRVRNQPIIARYFEFEIYPRVLVKVPSNAHLILCDEKLLWFFQINFRILAFISGISICKKIIAGYHGPASETPLNGDRGFMLAGKVQNIEMCWFREADRQVSSSSTQL